MRWSAASCALAFLIAGLSGCADDGASADIAVDADEDPDELAIAGLVTDEELVPVPDATVSNNVNDMTVQTDANGRFHIGPLEPGDYALVFEKKGYASTTKTVTLAQEPIRAFTVTLVAVASDVPYHQSFTRSTFVICWSQNIVGGVPCTKLVDYVAGTNVSSSEKFAFTFLIPNAGLADMLVEVVWKSQANGKDMGFYIQTPPNQPLTGLVVKYFSRSGGSPLRGWLTAGIKNKCGTADCAGVFDATPNKVVYEGVTIGSYNNATVPYAALYLNHRTDAWFTLFYNRAGSRDYTSVPDN